MTAAALYDLVLRYGGLTLLHATVLAALTWGVCRFGLKQARPALCAALWTIVLLKFVIPPVLPGELALSGWLAKAPSAAERAVGVEFSGELDWAGSAETVGAAPALHPVAQGAFAGASLSRVSWRGAIGFLYLIGLAAVTWRWMRHRLALARQIRAWPVADDRMVEEVAALAHRVGLMSVPQVRTTREAISPFISGFSSPTLILPVDVLASASAEERDSLILHELAHLRRGDLLIRGVENFVRLAFYFWPPVGWVCRQIERFSEMACDQWAVLAARVSPDVYANSLLKVVRCCTARPVPAGATLAFARRGRLLEERFHMILEKTCKTPRYSWLGTAAVIAWAAFALTGGAAAQDAPEKQPPAPAQNPPPARPNVDMDQPVLPERAKALIEQYGEEGIDANSDGTLTRREVFEFYKKKGLPLPGRPGGAGGESDRPAPGRFGPGRPGPGGPADLLELFERFLRIESGKISRERILMATPRADADHDGKLSDEEFAKALDFAHEMAVKRLLEAQPATDKDGDGKLSDEEIAAFKTSTLERVGQRILAANKEADKDSDGKLSEEEFLSFREAQALKMREEMLQRHPETDTDKDGKLSEEEFRAAEQKMRDAAGRGRPGGAPGTGPQRPLPGELKKDAPESSEPSAPKP